MAHPHDKVLGNAGIIVIDENQGAVTPPSGRIISSFRSMAAAVGTFTVKGHDIYAYVAANGGNGTYYDSDGVLLGATHAAGYYRAKETTAVTMEVDAGGTIEGKFTSVDATDGNLAVCYLSNYRD
jgi:hypothetical protein